MDTKYIRNSFRLLYGMLLLTVIYSCANIGSPNGGPYDETPPKFVSSTPVPNQINYTGKKIEILFDELIQIEKPSENVIITPPQMELHVSIYTGVCSRITHYTPVAFILQVQLSAAGCVFEYS